MMLSRSSRTGAAAVSTVTQGIQKGLLRSLELARIARKPADNLDAFGHELRGRLKLLVDSITARGGGLELLLEAVLPPVGAILPLLGAILSSCDRVENRLDAFEARADLTLHDAQYINRSGCTEARGRRHFFNVRDPADT